jgi:hypothetical protein
MRFDISRKPQFIRVLILIIIQINVLCYVSFAQNHQSSPFQLSEYWRTDSANSATIIGRKVKIWNAGGMYVTLNTDTTLQWPSEQARMRAGENGWGDFKPKTGDTGTIAHVFIGRGESERKKFIYLLKIKENYVPINGFDITDLDKPDIEHIYTWDSLKNIDYAKGGCKFKLANINGNFSGAGESKIDSMSENCACDLIDKGIDTVLLCKSYSGVSSTSTAVVFWQNQGKGYMSIFLMKKGNQLDEKDAKSISISPLLNYFFNNKLDTITKTFKPKFQAEMPDVGGLSIQLYTPTLFFRQFIPQLLMSAYRKDPEIIWWQMVEDKIREKIKGDE